VLVKFCWLESWTWVITTVATDIGTPEAVERDVPQELLTRYEKALDALAKAEDEIERHFDATGQAYRDGEWRKPVGAKP
jgi:hypothetical protein